MASKKRTTMAKLQRERRVLERRLEKQAKRDEKKASARLTAGPEYRSTERGTP
jgi:hypothetical protein